MKTATPTTAAELEEQLDDPKIRQNLLTDKDALSNWLKDYIKASNEVDPGIVAQIKAETQRAMADYLREQGATAEVKRLDLANARPAERGVNRAHRYSNRAPGAGLDTVFGGDVEKYLQAIYHDNHSPEAAVLRTQIRNQSSVVPSEGGFLVPESMRATLLSTALETSVVRPRATVIPMETARVGFPVIDTTSNVASVFGGMIAFWTEEGARLQKSAATFSKVVLDAKKLTGYSVVPNELFTDSIMSFEAFLSQVWPLALAYAEDAAFLDGTGAGEPLGLLRAAATVTVAAEGGQAAGTITWPNIVKMYARMLPQSLGRAVWIANIETFPQLATMALTVGTGGSAVWLNNGVEGPPATILGRPVIFTEKANALGQAGDISFVDPSFYLIGDRQTMQMATSEHKEFDTDSTAVRIISRVDGLPWLPSAITPRKGSATLSAYVRLAARP